MSRIVIVILIYHRHKPIDLKYDSFREENFGHTALRPSSAPIRKYMLRRKLIRGNIEVETLFYKP
jgi:hypothetical protein